MRICPECGIRELEKRCTYCSECYESRRYFQLLIARDKWIKNNPEKYKKSYEQQNKKPEKKIARAKYRAANKEKIAEYERQRYLRKREVV